MVNKLIVTCQIVRWLSLLEEFNLKVVYKLGRVHFLPNHLFKIGHGEPAVGIKD
jgi:hypothetical protein